MRINFITKKIRFVFKNFINHNDPIQCSAIQ